MASRARGGHAGGSLRMDLDRRSRDGGGRQRPKGDPELRRKSSFISTQSCPVGAHPFKEWHPETWGGMRVVPDYS